VLKLTAHVQSVLETCFVGSHVLEREAPQISLARHLLRFRFHGECLEKEHLITKILNQSVRL